MRTISMTRPDGTSYELELTEREEADLVARGKLPKVVAEDEYRWAIECGFAGCSNIVNVAKRVGVPTDPPVRADGARDWANATVVWKTQAIPTIAPRCVVHPFEFPESKLPGECDHAGAEACSAAGEHVEPCSICTLPEVREWIDESRDRRIEQIRAEWHDEGHPVSLDEFFVEWISR